MAPTVATKSADGDKNSVYKMPRLPKSRSMYDVALNAGLIQI